MNGDPTQGRPGPSKTIGELRNKYCIPNVAENVQKFVNNCPACIKAKLVKTNSLTPPLEPIYVLVPIYFYNSPGYNLEKDLVGELLRSNG